ncbi:DNA polymerase III subunit alpha [Mycoplasmopsis agassizii]|uniref:DNA polymerase III subunit alpha n=1 Tax=Mycoplasmopsis agassizii TaxID=33922 RepID=UPI0035276CBB
MNNFVNLHLNTEFSFLNSKITIKDLIEFASENQMQYLAITDQNNMYAHAEFYFACLENNIKPIFGLELFLENHKRIILIAKSNNGLINLRRLSFKALTTGHATLLDLSKVQDDLIIINHPREKFRVTKNEFLENQINDFYNSENNLDDPKSLFIQENKIMNFEDNEAIKIMNFINSDESNKEMVFNVLEDGKNVNQIMINRIHDLVKDINITFEKPTSFIPKFSKENTDSKEILKAQLIEAFNQKNDEFKSNLDEAKNRLKNELRVITKLGFEDYFLIISKIIKYAKNTGVLVGPGRGSAAGSLVAYLLKITDVNPLKYNLLFERFLNEERVTLPDIDIDIEASERDHLINAYIAPNYGKSKVASITTYSYLAAKSALKDINRYYQTNEPENSLSVTAINELSKYLKDKKTIAENLETNKELQRFMNKGSSGTLKLKEIYLNLFEKAKLIEGAPRQSGTHAAGLIISDEDLINYLPVTQDLDKGFFKIQYDKEYLEKLGFLKIDFLSLQALTVVKSIIKFIKTHSQNANAEVVSNNLDLAHLDPNNIQYQEDIKDLISSGKTIGLFQIESNNMTNVFKRAKVNSFKDIYDIIALYRPGPMEYINTYIENKHNPNKIEKIHPVYDEILKQTNGVLIYQEQVMEIAQKIAGLSFAKADLFRRAIGKKDQAMLDSMKGEFLLGAKNNGFPTNLAENIFEKIQSFAEYGFNKSHAVAYAYLTYYTAYLKAKFPLYFYAAQIEKVKGDQDKLKLILDEIKDTQNIKVASPTINRLTLADTIDLKTRTIYLPLDMIKSFGESTLNKLLVEFKTRNKFTNFYNFAIRAKMAGLTQKNIELLIEASVLREFGTQNQLKEKLTDANLLYKELEAFAKLNKQDTIDIDNLETESDFINENERDVEQEKINEQKYLGRVFNFAESVNLGNMQEEQIAELEIMITRIGQKDTDRGGNLIYMNFTDAYQNSGVMFFKKNNQDILDQVKKDQKYLVRIQKNKAKNSNNVFSVLEVLATKENDE